MTYIDILKFLSLFSTMNRIRAYILDMLIIVPIRYDVRFKKSGITLLYKLYFDKKLN